MLPPGKLGTGEQLNSRALFTHRVCLVLPESRTLAGICGPGKGLRRPEAVCSGCTFAPRMAPPQEHRSLGTGRPEDVTERDPVGRALTGRAAPPSHRVPQSLWGIYSWPLSGGGSPGGRGDLENQRCFPGQAPARNSAVPGHSLLIMGYCGHLGTHFLAK